MFLSKKSIVTPNNCFIAKIVACFIVTIRKKIINSKNKYIVYLNFFHLSLSCATKFVKHKTQNLKLFIEYYIIRQKLQMIIWQGGLHICPACHCLAKTRQNLLKGEKNEKRL